MYILRCADGSYYTGHTDDLEKCLAEHRTGQVAGYTATRCPVTLLFSEAFSTREEALTSERRIKGWSRKKKEGHDAGGLGGSLSLGERRASGSINSPQAVRQAHRRL